MQITATQAKNRFGYFCAQAKVAPVVVAKDGRPDSVSVSYDSYRALKDAAANSISKSSVSLLLRLVVPEHCLRLRAQTQMIWKRNKSVVTKSLGLRQREFNETYKDWIAEQHRIVEEFGVFGEEHRPW